MVLGNPLKKLFDCQVENLQVENLQVENLQVEKPFPRHFSASTCFTSMVSSNAPFHQIHTEILNLSFDWGKIFISI